MNSPEMGLAARLELRTNPALVAFAQLLALPVTDLVALVERELAGNPALDRDDRRACAWCGQLLTARRCRRCLARAPGRAGASADGDVAVAETPSVAERLMADVSPLLDSADRPIACYVLGDLDSRGLLGRPMTEVAADLGVDAHRVAGVVAEIRRVGPPGVCATDVSECLLLQLSELEARGGVPALVRRLVTDHLGDLAESRMGRLARRLGATVEEITVARRFIVDKLRPYVVFEEPVADRTCAAFPDVVVRRLPGDDRSLEVETTAPASLSVRVDPMYARLASQGSSLPACQRREIADQVVRAENFLARLRERSNTLCRIAQHAVEAQREYILGERAERAGLTRAQVAVALGVHESTVSRAVSDKTVLLPTGATIPLARLFGPARSVHGSLQAVVAREPRPLSDAELAKALAADGHDVARRTVAKYRAELGIPAQHLR